MDFNTLEPELKILKNEEVEDSTRQIYILRNQFLVGEGGGGHSVLAGNYMWKFLGKYFWRVVYTVVANRDLVVEGVLIH